MVRSVNSAKFMRNLCSNLILNKSAKTLIRKLYINKVTLNMNETTSLEVVVNVSIHIV